MFFSNLVKFGPLNLREKSAEKPQPENGPSQRDKSL